MVPNYGLQAYFGGLQVAAVRYPDGKIVVCADSETASKEADKYNTASGHAATCLYLHAKNLVGPLPQPTAFFQSRSERITIDGYEIEIEVNQGGGTITTNLKEPCSFCNSVDCEFSCDQSQYDDSETQSEAIQRHVFNHRMDGIESLLLAMACEGIDLRSSNVKQAIKTALDACGNQ